MRFSNKLFPLIFLILLCCKPASRNSEIVRIRLSQDPGSLNPVSYSNKDALQIINLLYQSLLTIDLADGTIKPLLAEKLPDVEKNDTASYFTFRIKEQASWNNQTPVTAEDVAFSLKVLQAPLVHNEKSKPAYSFIKDIVRYPEDPKRFTLVCDAYTPEMDLLSGDMFILPRYLADPENHLADFTLPQLRQQSDALATDPKIIAFAEAFNSEKFARDPAFLKGSSGYELKEWQTGQFIKLQKKKSWWAENLNDPVLTARPSNIRFSIIPDNSTAVLALKNKQLDVFDNLPAQDFKQLQQDKKLTKTYAFFNPSSFEFIYLGINTRLPQFNDKLTRQALAHLIDITNTIKVTQQNFAVATIGLIPPANKTLYNNQVKPFAYDLARTEKLLQQAGWRKEAGGWFKNLNGKPTQLTFKINYKAGNTAFEQLAAIIQQSAAKVNIPVTIEPLESTVLADRLKAHQSEVFIRSMIGNPFVYNFNPIFHTSGAAIGGPNYTGFGTPQSDKIIEALQNTGDEQEKARLLKQLQQIMHDESALVFLYFLQNRIVVSKAFENVKISGIEPGYDVSAFIQTDK